MSSIVTGGLTKEALLEEINPERGFFSASQFEAAQKLPPSQKYVLIVEAEGDVVHDARVCVEVLNITE